MVVPVSVVLLYHVRRRMVTGYYRCLARAL
jgi:hypothetical protein